jgi:hypothetical protein
LGPESLQAIGNARGAGGRGRQIFIPAGRHLLQDMDGNYEAAAARRLLGLDSAIHCDPPFVPY